MVSAFERKVLTDNYSHRAEDGSEIRLLSKVNGGGLCHCTLPVGKTSKVVKHKTVEKIWYFLSGEAEMWQDKVNGGEPFKVKKGDSVNIPLGNSFQFRNTGTEPLYILSLHCQTGPEMAKPILLRDIGCRQLSNKKLSAVVSLKQRRHSVDNPK